MKKNVLLTTLILLLVSSMGWAAVNSTTPPPDYSQSQAAPPLRLSKVTTGQALFLIIKDVDPWGIAANEKVLQEDGISYDIASTSQLGSWDFSGYACVIVASDQNTSSYNNLIANSNKLADFVNAGGILLAHAADMGWNNGSWTASWLPDGVTHVLNYDDTVEIIDSKHAVVKNISDDMLDNWNFSTHGYFTNVSASTVIADDGKPTYIEYDYGLGVVLATCQTIEWPFKRRYGTEQLLRNEISYALELIGVPPIADFNSDKNCGIAPLAVNFVDESIGYVMRRDWNLAVGFGGGRGIHVGDRKQYFEYWFPGNHDVSLWVANRAGEDDLTRWNCDRSFIDVYGPCGYTSMEVESASPAFPKEPWENAIDGDIWGWDGTATVEPDNAWAIFKFKDGRTKKLTKVRLLTNTGVGYKARWIHDFHVDVSTDGVNWTTALSGHHEGNFKIGPDMWDPDGGWWQDFMFDQPVMASYVKLVVDNPPPNWAQIGEFEVYEDMQLPDPAQCSITATGPHYANGIDASTVTLTLLDKDGQPVTGYNDFDIQFSIMWTNPSTYEFSPVTEISPGVYQTMLTSTTEGTKKIVAAAHGAVVGYHKDYGWTTEINFISNVYEYGLKIVESSESFSKEPWSNIIDGDYEGWDGTATVKGDHPYAILAFQNDGIYKVSKFGIQTDNGTDDDSPKVANRQAKRIRIEVSTTGLEKLDFTTVLEGRIKSGDLQYFRLPSAVDAKYIKLVVLEPNWGADTWRQIVEFEVHLDVKGDLPKELADEAKQADTFALEQNYPNPFNPTTAINYQLPEDAHVTLEIYNTLGQQVATLVDGFVEAGSHRVSWNAIDMPAGVYIYRIQAGKYSKAARMILLK